MSSTFTRKLSAAAASGVVVLSLAACGGTDPAPTTEPTTSTAPADESPTASGSPAASGSPEPGPSSESTSPGGETRPSSSAAPAGDYSTETRMSAGFPDPAAPALEGEKLTLDTVRVGEHASYDRIVFAHAGGQPGWRAEYTDDPTMPGSGQDVTIDGDAVLVVYLTGLRPGMGGEDEGHTVLDTDWPGQDTVIEQTITTGVYEGAASYFIGLDEERPFAIEMYDDGRLVIDFQK